MISIITPTYNRSKYLERVYESIKKQDFLAVEWIVVDDGSSDDTKDLIKNLIKKAPFKIKYYYQDNSGKMAAINRGMKEVTQPLVFCLDSDDFLLDGALNSITEALKFDSDDIAGFVFKHQDKGQKNPPFGIKKGNLFILYNKYNYVGETVVVFKTKVRSKYQYELEGGEKFITESYLYNKIARDYNYYFFDKDITEGAYLEDGYSQNIHKYMFENPKGYLKYYKAFLNMPGDIRINKRFSVMKNLLFINFVLKGPFFKNIKGLKFKDRFLLTLLYLPALIKYKIKWSKHEK